MKKSRNKNNQIEISDEPIGDLKLIADFLPPPGKLIEHEEVAKITLSVDTETIDFFKDFAARNGSKYQRMMRAVLKGYARKYGT